MVSSLKDRSVHRKSVTQREEVLTDKESRFEYIYKEFLERMIEMKGLMRSGQYNSFDSKSVTELTCNLKELTVNI